MKNLIIGICFIFLLGCELPEDPKGSLESLKSKTPLQVGLILTPRYAEKKDNSYSGSEVDLLRSYSRHLETEILFKEYSIEDGFKALEEREVHLLIGGFHGSIPFKKVGFTRPYNSEKNVIAVQRGENAFLVDLEKFLKKEVRR